MEIKYKLWTEDDLNLPSQYKEKEIPYIKSFACMQNERFTMEDKAFVSTLSSGVCFCGVLDGHGGISAVEHFISVLPEELGNALSKIAVPTQEQVREVVEEVFLNEDKKWCNKNNRNKSGTTFTGVLIFSGEKKAIYLINLGDSRTVLCSDGKPISSQDHKPDDISETKRNREAGGWVSRGRVNGTLAVSRALGDVEFKGRVKI